MRRLTGATGLCGLSQLACIQCDSLCLCPLNPNVVMSIVGGMCKPCPWLTALARQMSPQQSTDWSPRAHLRSVCSSLQTRRKGLMLSSGPLTGVHNPHFRLAISSEGYIVRAAALQGMICVLIQPMFAQHVTGSREDLCG